MEVYLLWKTTYSGIKMTNEILLGVFSTMEKAKKGFEECVNTAKDWNYVEDEEEKSETSTTLYYENLQNFEDYIEFTIDRREVK